MGRKREKGKARKAKATAAAQLAATQQVSLNVGALELAMVGSPSWRIWAQEGSRCAHGCPVLPAPEHALSHFMDALWAHSSAVQKSCYFVTHPSTNTHFDNYRQVWDNATLRKLESDILVAIGTNIILSINHLDRLNKSVMNHLALTIFMLEQYNGNGKDDFNLAMRKASLVADDLSYGGEREVVRFFLKRISCPCLKAKYSLIKNIIQHTRMSGCSSCKQAKVRSSVMHCGRCKVVQYCCRECQAADWPNHKGLCRSIGMYLSLAEMESDGSPSDLDDDVDSDDDDDDDDDSIVKDSNAPKRNQSSFCHYSNATRSDVKTANPTATFGEIARIISCHFQALSEEERAYWDEKAAQDKIRYQREMEIWLEESF
jgi:hypothetical protein